MEIIVHINGFKLMNKSVRKNAHSKHDIVLNMNKINGKMANNMDLLIFTIN